MTPRAKAWSRGLLAAGLVCAGVFAIGALVPKHLPEPTLANRVLARPHRIAVGQDVASTRLLRRIERLGYRRTRSATPDTGEYFKSDDRIVVHRREFVGPSGPVAPMRFAVSIGWGGRGGAIEGGAGAPPRAGWARPPTPR